MKLWQDDVRPVTQISLLVKYAATLAATSQMFMAQVRSNKTQSTIRYDRWTVSRIRAQQMLVLTKPKARLIVTSHIKTAWRQFTISIHNSIRHGALLTLSASMPCGMVSKASTVPRPENAPQMAAALCNKAHNCHGICSQYY